MIIKNLRNALVEVDPVDFPSFDVEPLGEVEVPDELGARLLEQPANWRQIRRRPPKE
jgi:hypothetical protein